MQIYMDLDKFEQMNGPNVSGHCKKILKNSDDFVEMSSRMAKKYAERTGADYVFLRDNPVINVNHPVNEKIQPLMPMWTEKYDQILYLDSDVFCWPEAPDLFEICPPNTFAITERKIFYESYIGADARFRHNRKMAKIFKIDTRFLYRLNSRKTEVKSFGNRLDIRKMLKYCYFNSGVFMVGGKEVGDEMMKYLSHNLLSKWSVEAVLNHMVAASNVNVFEFPKEFNMNPGRPNNLGVSHYFSHFDISKRSEKHIKFKEYYDKAISLIEEGKL